MKLEGRVIHVELDQEELRWISGVLVNIEPMAPRLRFEADTRMAQQPVAEPLDDVLADPEMSGMEDRHGAAAAPRLDRERQSQPAARRGCVRGAESSPATPLTIMRTMSS